MKRVKVDIKWNPAHQAFSAFDQASGKAIPIYSQLCYGDTPAAQAGTGDDPVESIKTLDQVTKAAVIAVACVGWATIPG